MMQKIVKSMSTAFFDSDLIASRLTLALAELCWAIMLMWPGDTFSRPTYAGMQWVMPEELWAIVFACSAILQIRVVLLDAIREEWAHKFALCNAVLWITVVGSMLCSVYPPPAAVGGEIALVCSAVWIYVRPLILNRGYKYAKYAKQ